MDTSSSLADAKDANFQRQNSILTFMVSALCYDNLIKPNHKPIKGWEFSLHARASKACHIRQFWNLDRVGKKDTHKKGVLFYNFLLGTLPTIPTFYIFWQIISIFWYFIDDPRQRTENRLKRLLTEEEKECIWKS